MKEFVHKIIKKLDSTCTYYTSSKKQKLFATATARTVSLIVGYNDENSDDDYMMTTSRLLLPKVLLFNK